MRFSFFPMMFTLGVLTSALVAEEKAMSVSEVLKHTPEDLAQKLGNSSEAGQDHAARLWAAAKRIETESLLGKTSVQAVKHLDQWRKVLNDWADQKIHARGIESGGGTMWSHMSSRNDAYIESFLAKHMTTLSVETDRPSKEFKADYLKEVIATIDGGLKEWKDNESMQELGTTIKVEAKNTYIYLKYLLKTLPEGETKQAVIELIKPSSD